MTSMSTKEAIDYKHINHSMQRAYAKWKKKTDSISNVSDQHERELIKSNTNINGSTDIRKSDSSDQLDANRPQALANWPPLMTETQLAEVRAQRNFANFRSIKNVIRLITPRHLELQYKTVFFAFIYCPRSVPMKRLSIRTSANPICNRTVQLVCSTSMSYRRWTIQAPYFVCW